MAAIRITPAYAGKSSIATSLNEGNAGSPPPMRGKVLGLSNRCQSSWDHPRLCGEKPGKVPPLPYLVGSPPPMRGKG